MQILKRPTESARFRGLRHFVSNSSADNALKGFLMCMLPAFAVLVGLSNSVLADDKPADPIVEPGEHSLFDGKLKISAIADGAKLRIVVTLGDGSVAETVEGTSATAKGWFVVAESAGKVWVYKGELILLLMEYADNPPGSPHGGKSSTVALAPGDARTAAELAKAPKSVVERLPAAFKSAAHDK